MQDPDNRGWFTSIIVYGGAVTSVALFIAGLLGFLQNIMVTGIQIALLLTMMLALNRHRSFKHDGKRPTDGTG